METSAVFWWSQSLHVRGGGSWALLLGTCSSVYLAAKPIFVGGGSWHIGCGVEAFRTLCKHFLKKCPWKKWLGVWMALAKPPGVPRGGAKQMLLRDGAKRSSRPQGAVKPVEEGRAQSRLDWRFYKNLCLGCCFRSWCHYSSAVCADWTPRLFSFLGPTQKKGLCSALFSHGGAQVFLQLLPLAPPGHCALHRSAHCLSLVGVAGVSVWLSKS